MNTSTRWRAEVCDRVLPVRALRPYARAYHMLFADVHAQAFPLENDGFVMRRGSKMPGLVKDVVTSAEGSYAALR